MIRKAKASFCVLLEYHGRGRESLGALHAQDAPGKKTLQELLREKVSEKKTELDTVVSEPASLIISKLDPVIVELYQGVRDVLQKYRSGKLPKAFKIIPKLPNWEQVKVADQPEVSSSYIHATMLFPCLSRCFTSPNRKRGPPQPCFKLLDCLRPT